MSRPSDPLLAWLRKHLDRKGWNTARVAEAAGLDRGRVRKLLAGSEPMLVDELLAISRSLELSPADMAGLDMPEIPDGPVAVHGAEALSLHLAEDDAEDPGPRVDPWGNQPEQLVRVAFMLGCDFFLLLDASQLQGSGVPQSVLTQYRGKDLPIKLDAAYHPYNTPQYDPLGLSIRLSFDALYECRFPWSAFKQVIFFPVPPDPSDELASDESSDIPVAGAPHLRLVT